MIPHKYIKLYNTQEDWQQTLDSHELEEVAVAAILEDRQDTPDKYQYSTRTTNKDNERLGPYNALDPINYFGGLEIIWGYWGWKWEDVTYNGEVLHGGHFEAIKDTTVYPQIQDGYRLQHIDNLTASTPNVTKVGYFDASNVVSAQNAFKRNIIINTFDYPKLKNATRMFRHLSNYYLQGNNLNFPELETMPETLCNGDIYLDSDPTYVINFGKVQSLNLIGSTIYIDGQRDYTSPDCVIDINKYFKGLDNCSDYSNLQSIELRNTSSSINIYLYNKYSFILEPTFNGTVALPALGPLSKVKLSYPATFGSYENKELTLVSSCSSISAPSSQTSLNNWSKNKYSTYVGKGLDIDYDKIIINYPSAYLAGFMFDTGEVLPFYSKIGDALMYRYCLFKGQNFEFDCTEGSYQSSGRSTFTEFEGCYCLDSNITLKNVLNHQSINLSKFTNSGNSTLDIGLQGVSELSDKKIKLNTTFNLLDVAGITFKGCEISDMKANLSDCTFISDLYYRDVDIIGSFNNVSFINGKSIYRKISLEGDFSNVSFDFGAQYTIELKNSEGDYSGVSVHNIVDNSTTSITCKSIVKTPILYGESTHIQYNILSSSPNSIQEINFQNFKCLPSSDINRLDVDLNQNTVLRIINLGQGWRTLRIGHAKLVDKDSLYQSIVRRQFVPTNSSGNGELWLHRDVWSQYTDEEKTFIQSKFDVIKVVEDESGE